MFAYFILSRKACYFFEKVINLFLMQKVHSIERIYSVLKALVFFVFCFSFSVFGDKSLESLLMLKRNESGRVSCEELTDNFCETLWSAENQGNFYFPNGTRLLTGERRRHVMSNRYFIHLTKMTESRCRFPEDIKNQLGINCAEPNKQQDTLAQLEILLSEIDSISENEKSIRFWMNSINSILYEFEDIIQDIAYERAKQEYPNLSKKLWYDYNFYEKKAYYENYYDIKTKIMEAIYLNDPDWLRAVQIFKTAKNDILTLIEQMDLNPETKNIMMKKVSSVTLSLPYEDNRLLGTGEACAEYEDNAYYLINLNKITVCMGRVNGSFNEGALYGVIAHEIAHSVDPENFLLDVFKQSSMASSLKELYQSNASLSCEDWKKIKNETFLQPSEMYQLPGKLETLDQCLVDRRGLNDITPSSLDYISERFAEEAMDIEASSNNFSYLSAVEIFEDGVLKDNEFYLNPKLFEEANNGYFEVPRFQSGFFHDISVFIQEYKCQLLEYEEEIRAFSTALEETKKLRKTYDYYLYSLLGRNASELAFFNLSKTSSENFADWMSYKAMELRLEREKSVEERRSFLLADISIYCEPQGLARVAKDKTLIEKEYSRAYHPLNRNRRLNRFTPKIANLLECNRGEEIQKLDNQCVL